jgi:hypothetical protein
VDWFLVALCLRSRQTIEESGRELFARDQALFSLSEEPVPVLGDLIIAPIAHRGWNKK